MAFRRTPKRSLFQKTSLFFFKRPKQTALIWLLITVLGVGAYTTLLKREGFPTIQTPFALSQGAYLVNDAQKVDNDTAKPLSSFLLEQTGVKAIQTQSFDNFYVANISYEDDVNAAELSGQLQKQIADRKLLPGQATNKVEAFQFGFTERGDDLVVSFYSPNGSKTGQELAEAANRAADDIKKQNLSLVEDVSIINPYDTAVNPATGQPESTQKSFDWFGKRENGQNKFYDSVVIGISSKKDVDELELDKQVRNAVAKLNSSGDYEDYRAEVSGSNAPNINAQINELQQTLLEGLIAVLIVGTLVIALRASFITVISMVTVIAAVIGLFYFIGYSLNTITLFALILGLALIVDDTIIMVEALDAQRRKRKDAKEAVEVATGKVGRAMFAATTTAALSFAPLLFVGGILGSFIKAIPITIIAALITSLLVALVFIPFFGRFLLLGKKQMGAENSSQRAAKIEAAIAKYISTPMLWARHSRKKLTTLGIMALVIGFGFVGAGGYLFQKVTFNIFPNSKDTNQLSTTLTFNPGTDISQAEQITKRADKIIAEEVGSEFVKASYFAVANTQKATSFIDITDYKDRQITAPQLVEKLNNSFRGFSGAKVETVQLDAGPPASAFSARVESSQNREAASRLASDIAIYLESAELKRPDGSIAKFKNVSKPNPQIYNREDNKPYLEVSGAFIDNDTTTLVTLAQQAVEKEFSGEKIGSYGLSQDALSFNFGQEDENQDSFKTLAFAFPAVLFVIYLVLSAQFKSLLQPLLIFMAIPFSLFGITLGLYLTNNAFSFFAMLGFFALIGLSLKNTILLTDYANQARRAGAGAVDAAHEALAERFRPLIATSLTAVFSLIPLALTSPFWEGLTVVLICGLLSSTFLVVTVFPYYYLGSEYLRLKFSRKIVLLWLAASVSLIALLIMFGFGFSVVLAPVLAAIILTLFKKRRLI